MAPSYRSDKECAQIAMAAGITGTAHGRPAARRLVEHHLTEDEMRRALAYLESGKPVTGR
ncbi:hypothetical protein ABZX98_19245 [Streptomyces sp. NPDC002992]|uniref:hypothetical protein n=1 Tax=Streptomyces sp. NPDC002992 TaxID=3154273 RepID=UPI0033B13144